MENNGQEIVNGILSILRSSNVLMNVDNCVFDSKNKEMFQPKMKTQTENKKHETEERLASMEEANQQLEENFRNMGIELIRMLEEEKITKTFDQMNLRLFDDPISLTMQIFRSYRKYAKDFPKLGQGKRNTGQT